MTPFVKCSVLGSGFHSLICMWALPREPVKLLGNLSWLWACIFFGRLSELLIWQSREATNYGRSFIRVVRGRICKPENAGHCVFLLFPFSKTIAHRLPFQTWNFYGLNVRQPVRHLFWISVGIAALVRLLFIWRDMGVCLCAVLCSLNLGSQWSYT